jgi:glycosyltransferase involved in cell wall biosynthesis
MQVSITNRLRPTLWTFAQYPPRPLTAPNWQAQRRSRTDALSGGLPSIAIVTPSFDQGRFIDFTIESVLAQDYPELTYWVQDGGSRDSTLASLERHAGRLGWDSAPDRGQAHAINLGFSAVGGEIMAYLNSDDVLLPGALAYVGRFFRDNPEIDVIYGHRIYVDHRGMEIGRGILPRHDPIAIKWADYIPQETMFWRRRVWDEVGPFDETFQYALDWDFILRAQRAGFRFQRIPNFLAAFRVHDAQKTTAAREVGDAEQMRLRETHLGFRPTYSDINRAIRSYLRRHVIRSRLYDFGLLRA